jgi:hypothetical protein
LFSTERRLVDIETGERVEGELDAMIRRRDERRRQTAGERLTEELWMPSERAYFARLEDQKRQERLEFHEAHATRLRNTLEGLISYHEAEAEKYRENGHQEGAS